MNKLIAMISVWRERRRFFTLPLGTIVEASPLPWLRHRADKDADDCRIFMFTLLSHDGNSAAVYCRSKVFSFKSAAYVTSSPRYWYEILYDLSSLIFLPPRHFATAFLDPYELIMRRGYVKN